MPPRTQGQAAQKPGEVSAARRTDEAFSSPSRSSRKYSWKLNLCLWLPFFLSSFDLTVVATALPEIANHFQAFDQFSWGVTAFTLTSTAFLPIFGQLATTYGRHFSLQSAVAILTIGSILCATAPVWSVFLLGRAFQGLGTAGIENVIMIILADGVSLKEHARNVTIFQILSGVGYTVGPVIGGYLTNSNWRYCFVLPASIGALSVFTVLILRKDLVDGEIRISQPGDGEGRLQLLARGIQTLDLGGAALFIMSFALIILGTAWGGSSYPWVSTAVIAPIVIGALLLPIFVLYEYLLEPGQLVSRLTPSTSPMIPLAVLRNKDVGIICISAAALGAAMYSLFYFVAIYFILVEGNEPGQAGLQLLYYIPGLGVGVYSAMAFVNAWPRQTFLPLLLGAVVETAGIAALVYAVYAQDKTVVSVTMALAGVGSGLRLMPSNLHVAGIMRKHLAPAYSMLRFSQPFGGTLALTMMGAVFQNKLSSAFTGLNVSNISAGNTAALSAISGLSESEQASIRREVAKATTWAFISIIPSLALSMLASLFLGNVWISKKTAAEVEGESSEEDVGSHQKQGERIYTGCYLFGRNLWSGKGAPAPEELQLVTTSGRVRDNSHNTV